MNVGARPGTSAAVLGFPENGPYDVRPARLGQTATVVSQDAYGRGPVQRAITSVRGAGAPRQLGRAGRGRHAGGWWRRSSPRRPAAGRTGYGVPDSVVRSALGRVRGPVDTGPCA